MPESHEDIARVLDGPQRSRPFSGKTRAAHPCRASCRVPRAWKPGGTWGAWGVSRLPLQMEGWWQTPWPTSSTQIGFCHMALKFKVTWTSHTNMIEENPNSEKFTKWLFLVSVAQMLFSTQVENSSHFPHFEIYCQERLAIFPHILWCEERVSSHFPSPSSISSHSACVDDWLQQISSHFSTQSSKLENQTKNSLHFSNVWNFGKRSFPYINSTHAENSSHFPHIFFTFSSHLKFHSGSHAGRNSHTVRFRKQHSCTGQGPEGKPHAATRGRPNDDYMFAKRTFNYCHYVLLPSLNRGRLQETSSFLFKSSRYRVAMATLLLELRKYPFVVPTTIY